MRSKITAINSTPVSTSIDKSPLPTAMEDSAHDINNNPEAAKTLENVSAATSAKIPRLDLSALESEQETPKGSYVIFNHFLFSLPLYEPQQYLYQCVLLDFTSSL